MTVTIIALISAAVAITFGSTTKKARDSRRAADLEKIRVALEMYKQANGTYPTVSGTSPSGLSPTYIQAVPSDPKGPTYYYLYAQRNGGYGYSVQAYMEDGSNGNCDGASTPPCNLACGPTVCNYEVINP